MQIYVENVRIFAENVYKVNSRILIRTTLLERLRK